MLFCLFVLLYLVCWFITLVKPNFSIFCLFWWLSCLLIVIIKQGWSQRGRQHLKKSLLLHWEKNLSTKKNLDCAYSLSLRKNLAPSLSSSIETSTTILLFHFVTGIAFLVILWSTPWERFRDLKRQRKENVSPFV